MKRKKISRLMILIFLIGIMTGSSYLVQPVGYTLSGGTTITLSMPSTAYVGNTFYVDISVSGTFFSGGSAYLERYSSNTWSVVKTFTLSSSSFKITYSQSQAGTFKFRVRATPVGSVLYSNTETVNFLIPPSVSLSISHSTVLLTEQFIVTTYISQGSQSSYSVTLYETAPSGFVRSVQTFTLSVGYTHQTFIRLPLANDPGVYKYQVVLTPSSKLSNSVTISVQDTKMAGYTFELEETRTNYIRKAYIDYLNSFYFYKPANYKAQVHTTVASYSDTGFDFMIKYKRLAVYSYSWAPSVQVVFEDANGNRNARFYMINRYNDFRWGFDGTNVVGPTGTHISSGNPFNYNTWYDWRIRVYHVSADSTHWQVEFAYKLLNSNTWVTKATYAFTGSLSGIVKLKIGTILLYDYSRAGSTDRYYFSSPVFSILQDRDGDGLTDKQEYAFRNQGIMVDPTNPDTDGDGLLDGQELTTDPKALQYTVAVIGQRTANFGLISKTIIKDASWNGYYSNPTDKDTDNDGLNDGDELLAGSSPCVSDTDGDGVPDGIDQSPTLYDTESPAYADISGETFHFADTSITVPTNADGTFLYVKRVKYSTFNVHDYLIVKFEDERGIDKVKIWTTDKMFGDDSFVYTWTNAHSVLIGIDMEVGLLDSYTVHIKAVDEVSSSEYYATEFSFNVDSQFTSLLKKAGQLVQTGLNWVYNQIINAGDWLLNLGQTAINTAATWLREQYNRAKNFLTGLVTSIFDPVIEKLKNAATRIINAFARYQQGTLSSFISNLLGPFNDIVNKIFDFIAQYGDEIQLAIDVLKAIVAALNPLDLATYVLEQVGSQLLVSGLLEGMIGDIENITTNIENVFADIMSNALSGLFSSFLPHTLPASIKEVFPVIPYSAFNAFLSDIESLGAPAFATTFASLFAQKLDSIFSVSSASTTQLNEVEWAPGPFFTLGALIAAAIEYEMSKSTFYVNGNKEVRYDGVPAAALFLNHVYLFFEIFTMTVGHGDPALLGLGLLFVPFLVLIEGSSVVMKLADVEIEWKELLISLFGFACTIIGWITTFIEIIHKLSEE